MKKLSIIPLCLMFVTLLFCLSGCKKDRTLDCKGEATPSNITLYDKPLPVIQCAIQGKWELQYTKGGFCGTCVYPATKGEYLIINSGKIAFKDDSIGVIVDTLIYWKKGKSISNHPTYTLNYYHSPWYGPYPISYIVYRIHNDTLILMDNASDPFYYYYYLR